MSAKYRRNHVHRLTPHPNLPPARGKGLLNERNSMPTLMIQGCTYALLLFGEAKTASGPVQEVVTASNVAALYRCPVREVDAGGQRLIVVMANDPLPLAGGG